VPSAVHLLDQQHRRRERGVAGSYDALREHRGTLALELVLLQLRVAVRPDHDWRRARQEVDPVVVGAGRREAARLDEDVVVLAVLLEDVEEWALGVGREHVQARLGDIGAGRGGSGVRAEVEREARVWVAP